MATFGADTFTDTTGTTLQAHTPSGGGTWTKHASSAGDALITDANRVRNNGGAVALYYHSGAPASADYSVSFGVVQKSDNNGGIAGCAGRIDTAANTHYAWRHETAGTNSWELIVTVAGSATVLGSFNQNLTNDQEYTAKLEMVGTAIKGYVDGVERVSVTDSGVTAAGKAGLRATATNTNTAGLNLDNFLAADPAVPASLTVTAASASAAGGAVTFDAAATLTAGTATAPAQAEAVNLTGTVSAAGTLVLSSATATAAAESALTAASRFTAGIASSSPLADGSLAGQARLGLLVAEASALAALTGLTAQSQFTVAAAESSAQGEGVTFDAAARMVLAEALATAEGGAVGLNGGTSVSGTMTVGPATASATAESAFSAEATFVVSAANAAAAGETVTFDAASRMVLGAALADALGGSVGLTAQGVFVIDLSSALASADGAVIGAASLALDAATAMAAADGALTGDAAQPGFTFAAPTRSTTFAARGRTVTIEAPARSGLAARETTRSG